MLFSSFEFILFTVVVYLLLNYISFQKLQPILLLISSIIFYSFQGLEPLLVLSFVICIAIFSKRNILGFFLLLTPLFLYKYLPPIAHYFGYSSNTIQKVFNTIPPGLSFVTFTAIIYLVEKNKYELKKIDAFNFFTFFPQLIA